MKQESKDSAIVYIVLAIVIAFCWDVLSADFNDPNGDGWENTRVHQELYKRGISQKIESIFGE